MERIYSANGDATFRVESMLGPSERQRDRVDRKRSEVGNGSLAFSFSPMKHGRDHEGPPDSGLGTGLCVHMRVSLLLFRG